MKIKYGVGEPTQVWKSYTHYVDLETDYMYKLVDGEWVLGWIGGVPVDDPCYPYSCY